MNKTIFESQDSNTKAPLEKKGSAIKAIIVALLVDFLGIYVLGIIFIQILTYVLILTETGLDFDQIGYKMIEIGTSMGGAEPLFQYDMTSSQSNEVSSQLDFQIIIVMTIVLMRHVLGGYLCARIANHYEYRYSAIVGFIACTYWVVTAVNKTSVIENIICTALIFIAGLFGAYLYVRNKTNKRMKTTTNNYAV
ncbi:MAG: hypothetical protein GY931_19405 [Maribacter sp.]|nr:hypothetical protein [Maribacter sp.]